MLRVCVLLGSLLFGSVVMNQAAQITDGFNEYWNGTLGSRVNDSY